MAVRSSDCTSGHTILAQGTGLELETLSAKGVEFAHPDGELGGDLSCIDCRNGGLGVKEDATASGCWWRALAAGDFSRGR